MNLQLKHDMATVKFYDIVSAYPAMGLEVNDAPDLSNTWYLNFRKMPIGVLKSNLKKDHILFEVLTSEANDEKIVRSQMGNFHFKKAGKHKSWLCYKYVD